MAQVAAVKLCTNVTGFGFGGGVPCEIAILSFETGFGHFLAPVATAGLIKTFLYSYFTLFSPANAEFDLTNRMFFIRPTATTGTEK